MHERVSRTFLGEIRIKHQGALKLGNIRSGNLM